MTIADGFNLWLGRVLAEVALVGMAIGAFAVLVFASALISVVRAKLQHRRKGKAA